MTSSPVSLTSAGSTHLLLSRTRGLLRYAISCLTFLVLAPVIINAAQASPARAVTVQATARSGHTRNHAPVRVRPKTVRAPARVRSSRATLSNIAPEPNFVGSCVATSPTSCLGDEIAALDNARQLEGLSPLALNASAFSSLTSAEQIFAVINLERTARGLAPVSALTGQLNAVALSGAANSVDPQLQGWTLVGGKAVSGWASNWAGGLTVLGADYFWMYDDGVGFNVDCTTTNASGCWGHRDNVLLAGPTSSSCAYAGGRPELLMGAAELPAAYAGSAGIAEIMVTSCGGLPRDTTVTWAAVRRILFGANLS